MGRCQIIIEGTDGEQMEEFFSEIQNKYSLYDNCVIDSDVKDEDSIIDEEGRCEETGKIVCTRPVYKKEVYLMCPKCKSKDTYKSDLNKGYTIRCNGCGNGFNEVK